MMARERRYCAGPCELEATNEIHAVEAHQPTTKPTRRPHLRPAASEAQT